MEFKNIDEIEAERERLQVYKYHYSNAINDVIQSFKRSKKKNRAYFETVIENFKTMLKKINDAETSIDELVNQRVMIKKELFIPFVLECINAFEGEEYVYRQINLSLTPPFIANHIYPEYKSHILIFPKKLLEEEQKLESIFILSNTASAYRKLFSNNYSKYIMTPTADYKQLININYNLLDEYKRFPYLLDVGLNLLEKRLENPDVDINITLNEELEQIKVFKKAKNLWK